jgi:hypothetical protein
MARRASLVGMTAQMQTAGAAAQLREAARDLAQLASETVPDSVEGIRAWAALAFELADRYRVQLEGLGGRRGLRFIAVARNLDVRPYAVVTSDPRELRAAVSAAGEPDGEPPAPPRRAR